MKIKEVGKMNLSWIKKYTAFSIITTNLLVLFFVINFLSYVILENKNKFQNILLPGVLGKYGSELFENNKEIYGGDYNFIKIKSLLKEYGNLRLEYEPFVEFGEKKGFTSRNININQLGFRRILNQEDIDTNKKKVFVFGGSTTFGYGVSDSETIPSYLQGYLNSDKYAVFNFGRGFYYSKQQLVFFIQLLNKGFKPDIVISIDGVNEKGYKDFPSRSNDFINIFEHEESYLATLNALPVVQLMYKVLNRIKFNSLKSSKQKEWIYTKNSAKDDINYYLKTIDIFNKLCESHNIKYLAIYQPSHIYKYEYVNYHPFYQGDNKRKAVIRYPLLETMIDNNLTPDFLYSLMHLQENEKRPLYVDLVHYNPYFNKKIAEEINEIIKVESD